MTLIDALGYAAATLTTVSFMPQARLTFRTRDVSGISLAMYSAFTFGIALWLAYGVLLRAWPIVIANTVTLGLALLILTLKLRLMERRPRPQKTSPKRGFFKVVKRARQKA